MRFVFSGTLLRYVGYRRHIDYDAPDVRSALQALYAEFPEAAGVMQADDGGLRRSLRLAINQEVAPHDPTRPLSRDDRVEVMSAVSGG